MTDKVKKILSEISTRKLCTMDEHMAFYNDAAKEDYRFLSDIEELIKALQEETVSNKVEVSYDAKLNEAHRLGREEGMFLAKTMFEEPVSRDLEEAAKDYFEHAPKDQVHLITDAFKAGAKWQHKQLEKNRLAACDRQTEEEAEIERDFVMGIIEKEHRQPTFDDAIKYGMEKMKEQMMAEAVDSRVYIDAGGYPYIPQIELYDYDKDVPLAKEGDKYKVVLIKED